VVLALAVGAEADVTYVVGGCGVGLDVAVLVAGDRLVGLTGFEVCRGGVSLNRLIAEVVVARHAVVGRFLASWVG
jgi:hypothetical protein